MLSTGVLVTHREHSNVYRATVAGTRRRPEGARVHAKGLSTYYGTESQGQGRSRIQKGHLAPVHPNGDSVGVNHWSSYLSSVYGVCAISRIREVRHRRQSIYDDSRRFQSRKRCNFAKKIGREEHLNLASAGGRDRMIFRRPLLQRTRGFWAAMTQKPAFTRPEHRFGHRPGGPEKARFGLLDGTPPAPR